MPNAENNRTANIESSEECHVAEYKRHATRCQAADDPECADCEDATMFKRFSKIKLLAPLNHSED